MDLNVGDLLPIDDPSDATSDQSDPMTSVLVLGASGKTGRAVSRALAARGVSVRPGGPGAALTGESDDLTTLIGRPATTWASTVRKALDDSRPTVATVDCMQFFAQRTTAPDPPAPR